jgi:alpha-beta hydrolase superfamily lysophospholipase
MGLEFNRSSQMENKPEYFDVATKLESETNAVHYSLTDANGNPDRHMTVQITKPSGVYTSDKLVFIHHGRNGNAEAMRDIAKAYHAHGYIVVAANARNSLYNTSAGNSHDFTLGAHCEDMDRNITFAKNHAAGIGWTGKKFALAGFSMGGFAASFMASTKYRDETSHLMAIAPLISGERQIETRKNDPHYTIEVLMKEVPNALTEWPQHDLFKHLNGFKMPVSIIVGSIDSVTTPNHICAFADALKERGMLTSLDIIEGRHHDVINRKEQSDFTDLVSGRITELEAARKPVLTHIPATPDK